MTDNQCPQCGGVMATTHSRLKVSIIDRRRKCKQCGYQDRVFVREEIIRILPVGNSVLKHTLSSTQTSSEGV